MKRFHLAHHSGNLMPLPQNPQRKPLSRYTGAKENQTNKQKDRKQNNNQNNSNNPPNTWFCALRKVNTNNTNNAYSVCCMITAL